MNEKSGLTTERRSSVVGQDTSIEKLNGQYKTPFRVAKKMLDLLNWPGEGETVGKLLDPACGDGIFIIAAIDRVIMTTDTTNRAKKLISNKIIGWDLDQNMVDECRTNVRNYLSEHKISGVMPGITRKDTIISQAPSDVEYVVGNPPYLESKRMPDKLKEKVRRSCSLGGFGAFDLYSAFLDKGYQFVRPNNGTVCFIIPNRFLVTYYASKLRREFLENSSITVIDLSMEEIFHGADVYPIIVRIRVANKNEYIVKRFTSLQKNDDPSLKGIANIKGDVLAGATNGIMPTFSENPDHASIIKRVVSSKEFFPLSQKANIRWTVSFHEAGLRDKFLYEEQPPEDAVCPRKILGGGSYEGNREVEPFEINWSGWWIDYDKKLAREHDNSLPSLSIFEQDKIAICQNARRGRAAIDRDGHVLKDTFVAILLKNDIPEKYLKWLTLIINSDTFHFIYENLFGGTRKGGAYLHFIEKYLSNFPVPPAPEEDQVNDLYNRARTDEESRREIESVLFESYGLSSEERNLIKQYDYPDH